MKGSFGCLFLFQVLWERVNAAVLCPQLSETWERLKRRETRSLTD